MRFQNVIGQEEVKQHLHGMVQSNRLSHALLFLEKPGAGGLPLALAFAQYLVCEKIRDYKMESAGTSLFGEVQSEIPPSLPTDSCGKCPSCIKAAELIHPDIHFSYPAITKKPGKPVVSSDFIAEWREFMHQNPYGNVFEWIQFLDPGSKKEDGSTSNKQGNITAQECHDIIMKLSTKSFESGYKILLMWMPEYLGNAGNKLLKLIEEPPPNTIFIMIAENESLILPTILSRTQLIKIPSLEATEISNALVEGGNISKEDARQIAMLAEGSYRDALGLLQNPVEDWLETFRKWLNAIVKTGPIAQVKWVEEIAEKGREKQKQFLSYCTHLIEQAIRVQLMGADPELIPEKELDFAIRFNKQTGIEQQQAIIEEFDKASYYIERNANGKMLFHALTIKLYHIISDKSLILIG